MTTTAVEPAIAAAPRLDIINPDLSWMTAIHDDEHVIAPVVLPPLLDAKRTTITTTPHVLAISAGLAMVHEGADVGRMMLAPLAHEVVKWAVKTFFDTDRLVGIKPMTLDGLIRWVNDAPEVVHVKCPHCNGTRMTDETHPDDENMRLVCAHCDGHGFIIANYDAGLDKVGPIIVDRRALRPILPHLRGNDVALAIAPSVDRPGEADVHVRQTRTAPGNGLTGVFGAWRIVLTGMGER